MVWHCGARVGLLVSTLQACGAPVSSCCLAGCYRRDHLRRQRRRLAHKEAACPGGPEAIRIVVVVRARRSAIIFRRRLLAGLPRAGHRVRHDARLAVPAASLPVLVAQDAIHSRVVTLAEDTLGVAEGVSAVGGAAEATHAVVGGHRVVCHQTKGLAASRASVAEVGADAVASANDVVPVVSSTDLLA